MVSTNVKQRQNFQLFLTKTNKQTKTLLYDFRTLYIVLRKSYGPFFWWCFLSFLELVHTVSPNPIISVSELESDLSQMFRLDLCVPWRSLVFWNICIGFLWQWHCIGRHMSKMTPTEALEGFAIQMSYLQHDNVLLLRWSDFFFFFFNRFFAYPDFIHMGF